MTPPRLILIDGPPGTGRTRLGQEIMLQCAAQGIDHEFWPARRGGHPLLRPFDPAAYPDADAYGRALSVQWQNFATRAAASSGLHLFDAALLQPGLRALLEAGAGADRIEAIAAGLLEVAADLDATLLYLSRRDAPADAASDWSAWRDCCDGVFAALRQHRLLLNASRASADELLSDALDFLGLPRVAIPFPLNPERLAGRYGSEPPGTELLISYANGEVTAQLPEGVVDRRVRTLLPGADGTLLVAGEDLRLEPREADGRILGLLTESRDSDLTGLPPFMPRLEG